MDRIIEHFAAYGPGWLILALSLFGVTRAVKAAGPHVVRWGDKVLDHWIDSAKSRDSLLARLVTMNGEHELADEKRHHAELEKAESLAQQNRHSLKNELQTVLGVLDDKIERTREYLCEQIDSAVERITRKPDEDKPAESDR